MAEKPKREESSKESQEQSENDAIKAFTALAFQSPTSPCEDNQYTAKVSMTKALEETKAYIFSHIDHTDAKTFRKVCAEFKPFRTYREMTFVLVSANEFRHFIVNIWNKDYRPPELKLKGSFPLPSLPAFCKESVYGLYASNTTLLRREDAWFKYNKDNRSWLKYSSARQDAYNLCPVELDGHIMCIVGRQSLVEVTKIKDSMQMSWTRCRTDLPRHFGPPIFPCTLTKIGPNSIFMHGGFDKMDTSPWTFLTRMDEGSLAPNRKKILWKKLPSSFTPRGFHLSFKLESKFVIAGGIADNNDHLTSSEIYDIAEQTWTHGPTMPLNPLGLGAEGTMIVPFLALDTHEKFALVLGWVQQEPDSMKVIRFTLKEGFQQMNDVSVSRPPLSQHLIAIQTGVSKELKLAEEEKKSKKKALQESKTEQSDHQESTWERMKEDLVFPSYGEGKRAK